MASITRINRASAGRMRGADGLWSAELCGSNFARRMTALLIGRKCFVDAAIRSVAIGARPPVKAEASFTDNSMVHVRCWASLFQFSPIDGGISTFQTPLL